jgi:hypothetical protein
MRVIDLDATAWSSVGDVIDAILAKLDAPDWHGRNVNALLDSIVGGSINGVEPPYILRFQGLAERPHEVQVLVSDLGRWIPERLVDHNQRCPDDQRRIMVEGA